MWLTRCAGLSDVVCDTQRMREAIISIPATCLAARFHAPPFDLTLFASVLLGLLWKMLIKYHTHCRKSDKKVCLGETLEFQAKRAFVLVAGFPVRTWKLGGVCLIPFFSSPPKNSGRMLHIPRASPAGI